MPYISKERREEVRNGQTPQTAGELNYVFTLHIIEYFKIHSNYQGINDVVGALEGAKLEFYRRAVAPYEEEKILENGDLY